MELILLCIWLSWFIVYRTGVGAYCAVTGKTTPWVQARQQRLAEKSPEVAAAYAARRSERTFRGFLGTLWGDLWEDAHDARTERRARKANGEPGALRTRIERLIGWFVPAAPELETTAADGTPDTDRPYSHDERDTADLIKEAVSLPDPDPTGTPRGIECPDSPDGWHDRRTVETTMGRRRGCIYCRDGFGEAWFIASDARVLCPVHTPRGFCGTPVRFNNVNCGDHGPCAQSMTGQHETGAGSRACLHCGAPVPLAPESSRTETRRPCCWIRPNDAMEPVGCPELAEPGKEYCAKHQAIADHKGCQWFAMSDRPPCMRPLAHEGARYCDEHDRRDRASHAVEPYARDPKKVVVDAPTDPSGEGPTEHAQPSRGETLTSTQTPAMAEIANVQAVEQFGREIASARQTWAPTLESAETNIGNAGLDEDKAITASIGRMREHIEALAAEGDKLVEIMKPHVALAEQVSGTANHGSKIQAYENQ